MNMRVLERVALVFAILGFFYFAIAAYGANDIRVLSGFLLPAVLYATVRRVRKEEDNGQG